MGEREEELSARIEELLLANRAFESRDKENRRKIQELEASAAAEARRAMESREMGPEKLQELELLREEVERRRQAELEMERGEEENRRRARRRALSPDLGNPETNAPGVSGKEDLGMRGTAVGGPKVKRDMSLQNLVRTWSGEEREELTVRDFLAKLERVGRCGNWSEEDLMVVCEMKLTGPAAQFVARHPDLAKPQTGFGDYKRVLIERFGDEHEPEYYARALHAIKQGREENVREFAARCAATGQKSLRTIEGALESEWARNQLEQTVLAAFLNGLRGEPGKQLAYQPPADMKTAIRRATLVEQVHQNQPTHSGAEPVFEVSRTERGEEYKDLRTRFNPREPFRGSCFRCGQRGHLSRQCRAVRPNVPPGGQGRVGSACFVCGATDHWARSCPKNNQVPRVRAIQPPPGSAVIPSPPDYPNATDPAKAPGQDRQ